MSIKENLQKILDAVYGKDVRQAIHDSIEQGIEQCEEKTNIANSYTGEQKYVSRKILWEPL